MVERWLENGLRIFARALRANVPRDGFLPPALHNRRGFSSSFWLECFGKSEGKSE
jgi:hypothetical protein